MASRFSSVRQFMENKANQNREDRSVDSLIKQAQLKELGYDYQPRSKALGIFGGGADIVQNPNYVSTKSIEREKLFGDLEHQSLKNEELRRKAKREQEGFGQMTGSGGIGKPGDRTTDFVMTPDGKIRTNPSKMSPDESQFVSYADTAIPMMQGIPEQAEKVFGKPWGAKDAVLGPLGLVPEVRNFVRGKIADTGKAAFMTGGDKDLSSLQSQISAIRGYAFKEGGKALTNSEKDIVYDRTNVAGKSPERLKQDYAYLVNELTNKAKSIREGRQYLIGSQDTFGGIQNKTNEMVQDVQQAQGGVPEWVPDGFDYAGAKASGWSDAEIQEFLKNV